MVFPVASREIDQMILTLIQENLDLQDEIKELSRSWVVAVMGQPSKKDRTQPRSFDYSKKKILNVLKWRQENRLLASDLKDRIDVDGNPKQDSRYAFEFGCGCFYWYGTDVDGCPNLWYREDLNRWEDVNVDRRMEYMGLVIQSAINAMPPNIHNLNFILLIDGFNPIHAVRHPRLGLTFLQTFMKCCPDRLKRAVMVTGTTGQIFYNVAKKFAPKSLVDKITVMRNRSMAGSFMIEKGIIGRGSSSIYPLDSSSSLSSAGEGEKDVGLPTFLGGETVHEEEMTKNLPLMLADLKERMNMHHDGGLSSSAAIYAQ